MKKTVLTVLLSAIVMTGFAQQSDEEYRKVIRGRAEKIVATLEITDKAMQEFMTELIATQ